MKFKWRIIWENLDVNYGENFEEVVEDIDSILPVKERCDTQLNLFFKVNFNFKSKLEFKFILEFQIKILIFLYFFFEVYNNLFMKFVAKLNGGGERMCWLVNVEEKRL